MRIALVVSAALVAAVIVGFSALAIMLPRIAQSPETRKRIEQASTDALGRPLSYGDLDVELLPPHIVLSSPRLPGGTPDAPPLFEADRVDLRIALLPLFGFVVVIDSLDIRGLEIEVTRTDTGLDLPLLTQGTPTDDTGAIEEVATERRRALLELGVRRIRIHDAHVRLVDRTVSPPHRFALDSLQVEARGTAVDEPVTLGANANLATGGQLVLSGTTTVDGLLDVRLDLKNVSLSAVTPYLGDGVALDGVLVGAVTIRGDAAAPKGFGLDLSLEADRVEAGTTRADGRLALKADLGGEWSALAGGLEIDATSLRVESGESFVKPAGTPAVLSGKLGAGPSGETRWTLDRVELASLRGRGEIVAGEATTIALNADPFPAAGLLALLPDVAATQVSGELAIVDWKVRLEPLALSGEIRSKDLRIGLASGGSVEVAGRIVGRGDGVDLSDVSISTGGQRVLIAGDVRELSGDMPFRLELDSGGVLRADPLLTGLDPSMSNVVYGPLQLRGGFSGRAGASGGETALLDSLAGELTLEMGRLVGDGSEGGRIVGFSLLGSVFAGLDEFGEMTQLTRLVPGNESPDLTRFSNDAYDTVRVVFRVREGLLDTDLARLEYRSYAANLHGTIRLADLALDMAGEVQLGSEVAAVLGARAKDGEIVIPVARIGGTVLEPDVSVSKKAATSLVTQVVTKNIAIKGVLGEAEKVVPGAGSILGSGLNGIFGRGKKKPEPQPTDAAPPAEKAGGTTDAKKGSR